MRDALGMVFAAAATIFALVMIASIQMQEPKQFDTKLAYQIPIEQRDKMEQFVDNLSKLEKEYIKHYTEITLNVDR